MAYVLQRDQSSEPILRRFDHIICRVPDIRLFHNHFRDVLGFSEAWPIGKFWPSGNTSGIALGGINLEFVEIPGIKPSATTLVFEPSSIEAASLAFAKVLNVQTTVSEKIESNPELLRLRGFSEADSHSPQLICRNLNLEPEFPIDMFLCEYSPELRDRLAPSNFPMPHGRVLKIELELPKGEEIGKLQRLGYGGDITFNQSENDFGPCRITGIMVENGPVDLKTIDPGFSFI